MQVFYGFESMCIQKKPFVLTIGTFDGVHKGHKSILHKLKTAADSENGSALVVSFTNHPSEILRKESPAKMLCTLPHKIRLISDLGIDYLLLLPFTSDIAGMSAEDFLKKIRSFYHFSHLLLGYDTAFGKNKEGDAWQTKKIALESHFSVEYLSPIFHNHKPISSSTIRAYIEQGNFKAAKELLERPYSIYSTVVKGSEKGRSLGFPTANIFIDHLCLPPLGVYVVELIHKNQSFTGVANLGFAPTIKNTTMPALEVHLPGFSGSLYDEYVEVKFLRFIRPEKTFKNLGDLSTQIQKDIRAALNVSE